MALNVTINDVGLVALNISTSGEGAGLTLILDADWLALDESGAVIGIIGQQKDSESKLFSTYPQTVRDAIVVLNNYAEGRIKAAKGIGHE